MRGYVMALLVLGLALMAGRLAFVRHVVDFSTLKGQRVVITGASQGIGKGMLETYCANGAQVVAVARTKAKLEAVAKECTQLGGKGFYVAADLSQEKGLERVVEESMQQLDGRIDTVVLNHVAAEGLFNKQGWPVEGSLDGLRKLMEVNFFSYAYLAGKFLDPLTESKGRLIVVSSMAGIVPLPHFVPYATTKHALQGFFTSLRLDLEKMQSPLSITVALIGAIDTESNSKTLDPETFKMKKLLSAPVKDCAESIVAGGELRDRFVYYPFSQTHLSRLVYAISPWLMETIAKEVL